MKALLRTLYHKSKKPIWKAALRTYIATRNSYQPLGEQQTASGGRPDSAFQSRWEAVAAEIEMCKAQNLLDIGCAQGWFVRNANVHCNLFSLGLDQNREGLRLGSAFSELQGEEGYGFVPGTFSPEKLRQLPVFDVVICFSLVHHIVKVQGQEGGLEYLKACNEITNKCFLFDMGGPDEVSHTWAPKLDFLAGDLEQNIGNYLCGAGFTDVRKIGESMAHEDKVKRPLFACSPNRAK